jgi:LacI family transcriptional regulator
MPAVRRVGIVVQPTRMYCRRVVGGIAAVGVEAGWEWLLVPAEGMPAIAGASEGYLDGVIGHFSEPVLLDHLFGSGLPAVDISAARPGPKVVRVSSDDVAVGRLAATYFLSLGLPHFGFFGARSSHDSQSRQRGFQQTLAALGLPLDEFLWPAEGHEGDPATEPNGELERWVLKLPKPVGVLASNDRRALQILAVCRKRQIAVPQSVAVLGVDNDEVFCELANPPLSSIALSTQRIGYEAARTLDRLMRGQKPAQQQLLIPPAGVVPRRSSDIPAIVDADVAAAVRYISLHTQEHLHVDDVLCEVPLSRRSLEQRFQKALGRTPAQEIRRSQVELAKQVLAETDEPMARVALMAGFSNAKQLGATFHHEMQMTPTAYRRRNRIR